jgi:PAS domain S-box-containing protein
MEFVSEGCRALTGYLPDDLIENKKIAYAQFIHPEDREGVWKDVQEALERKASFRLVYRIMTAEGRLKWVWEQGCGVFDEGGRIQALEGFILDISERRKMEMELEQTAKEIELYNDILAHDIGNINQITLNNLNMLLSDEFGQLNEEQLSLLTACKKQVHRTSSLISKVKTVSQMRDSHTDALDWIDLAPVILLAISSVKASAKGKVLDVHFTAEKGKAVMADRLIHQLFYNLLENAVQHVKCDRVEIGVFIDEIAHKGIRSWKISIEDNGPGIKDEFKPLIFNRFEKGLDRTGSGIGLAIVRALTAKYNGAISVEDKVQGDSSQGSRFVLILPQAPS